MEKPQSLITELLKQLSELGYSSYQLEAMIKDTVGVGIGAGAIESMSEEDMQQLIETLQDHLIFAKKCRNKKL